MKCFLIVQYYVTDTGKVVNSYKFAFAIVGIFSVSIFIVTSTVKIWSLELRLLWKDRFGKLEENGKNFVQYVLHMNN